MSLVAILKSLAAVFLTVGFVVGPNGPASAGMQAPESRNQGKLLQTLGTGALATFDVGGERFRVWAVDPATIAQLKALKAGRSDAHIPNGRILPGPGRAGFNRPWNWHLDSRDVQMAEMTTEVCDGMPSYVNEHVDEFVTTVQRYCPWRAQLVSLQLIPSLPARPSNLRVVSIKREADSTQRTKVRLQWLDRSKNESGFRIDGTLYRKYGGRDGRSWRTGPNATNKTVTFVAGGINPVARACFTVTAVNASGESARSNRVCKRL